MYLNPVSFACAASDDEEEGGDSDDESKHAGLLKAIGALDGKGKNRFVMERTETAQEGEYGVGKSKVGCLVYLIVRAVVLGHGVCVQCLGVTAAAGIAYDSTFINRMAFFRAGALG